MPADLDDDDFRGPWFSCAVAARYVACKNTRAFYEWAKRHGVVKVRGRVAKADLDRVMRPKRLRSPRAMAPASLHNLTRSPRRRSA